MYICSETGPFQLQADVLLKTNVKKFQPGEIDAEIQLCDSGVKTLHDFGKALTAPAERMLEDFQTTKLGKEGEEDSTFALKVNLTFCGVFTIGALIAAAPAVLLRGIAANFRKDFSYSPAVPTQVSENHPPVNELKVMTWNTGMGPGFMSIDNRLKKPEERIDAVLDMIMEQQPNVLALQEVFDENATNEITRRLNEKGYDCIHTINSSSIGLSSGLFLAVKRNSGIKLAIEEIKVFKFTNLAGPDKFSAKGVVGARIRVSTGEGPDKKFLILNTHLQASYEDTGYGHIRMEQTRAIAGAIDKWKNKRDAQASVILCGDMNFGNKPLEKTDLEGEYKAHMEILSNTQLYNPNEADQKESIGSFYQLKGKVISRASSVVDYVFLSEDLRTTQRDCRIIELNPATPADFSSDHCPVVQTMSLD